MDDIDRKWDNFFKRVRSAARQHTGSIAFVQTLLVVNREGCPLFWIEPKVVPAEPRLEVNFSHLMENLSQEDLENVLKHIVQIS